MASSIQSNPTYYSVSSGQKPQPRTVVIHKRPDHSGFGVFIGEDVPLGLYVITVERNSPAADANIQPGDRVIAVNGQSVSSMSGNPKDAVLNAATNAESLTLTLQSSNLMDTLDTPFTYSDKDNDTHTQQRYSPKQTLPLNTDLENYIKSLFLNENIQILPSKVDNHEFYVTSDPKATSSTNLNSFSHPSRNSHSSDYKQESRPTHSNDQKKERRRHRHRHHPKPTFETKETQTSNNEDDEEIPEEKPPTPPALPHPSYRTTTAATPSPVSSRVTSDSAKSTPPPSKHMAEVVKAAVAASKSRGQPSNREQVSSRDAPAPVTQQRTPPPTSRDLPPENSSRDLVAPAAPPPPYTVTDTLAPAANNPENAHEGVYNVRDAQENREGEPAQPESRNNATAVRPEGLRELHLQRSPNFQGYGFHLQYNRAYYLVQRIEEGSPAEQAGLYANDVICKLEQQPTESMAHDDFVQKVSNSSDITMVVQYVDEYLRANPQPPRNQQVASAVTAALNNENDKLKIGPLKALNKITNR